MVDYLRPAAQWADDTGEATTDLLPWSFDYDPETRVVTLLAFRRRVRSGLAYTSSVTEGGVTTRTWTLEEFINGQLEMQVALSGTKVLVFPPPLPAEGAPGSGNDFNLYADASDGNFALQPVA